MKADNLALLLRVDIAHVPVNILPHIPLRAHDCFFGYKLQKGNQLFNWQEWMDLASTDLDSQILYSLRLD